VEAAAVVETGEDLLRVLRQEGEVDAYGAAEQREGLSQGSAGWERGGGALEIREELWQGPGGGGALEMLEAEELRVDIAVGRWRVAQGRHADGMVAPRASGDSPE